MVRFLFHNTVGAWRAARILAALPELAREAASEAELAEALRIPAMGGLPSYDFEYLRFVRDAAASPGAGAPAFRTASDGAAGPRAAAPEAAGPWRPAAGGYRAARILVGEYDLVVTNVPYLAGGKQAPALQRFVAAQHPDAKADLATAFVSRGLRWLGGKGAQAVVVPQNWLFLKSYRKLRERLLDERTWRLVARLGPGAFETISGEVVNVALVVLSGEAPAADVCLAGIDVSAPRGERPIRVREKAELLRASEAVDGTDCTERPESGAARFGRARPAGPGGAVVPALRRRGRHRLPPCRGRRGAGGGAPARHPPGLLRRGVVGGQGRGTPGRGQRRRSATKKGPHTGRLAARPLLRAAREAVPQPAVHLAPMGRPPGWLSRPGELPPPVRPGRRGPAYAGGDRLPPSGRLGRSLPRRPLPRRGGGRRPPRRGA